MKRDKFKKAMEKSWLAAIVYIGIWLIAEVGLFYYSTEVTHSMLPFIFGFLFVYPIGTLVMTYMYSKRNGLKWYFFVAMTAIVVMEYFVFGFDSVEPNLLVMTGLALLFGSLFGNLFCLQTSKNDKRNPKEKYKKILDD